MSQQRTATINRTTRETDIQLSLNLDGSGQSDIDTGVGFFNHMLELVTKHGQFDLTITQSRTQASASAKRSNKQLVTKKESLVTAR